MGTCGIFDLASLVGINGFVIKGVAGGDRSGFAVSSAGDVNGDGIDDLIIGAWNADPHGKDFAGESYVVFGAVDLGVGGVGTGGMFDLSSLNGDNGFVLKGIDPYDASGRSVSSAGDLNGDGFDDLVIGAWLANTNGQNLTGESYVVFGAADLGVGGVGTGGSFELSSLNGSSGFVLNGVDARDRCGISVSSAGDVNGDGIDDLIIGAREADQIGKVFAGESYVLFGAANLGNGGVGMGGTFDLSSLNGFSGFAIRGIDADDYSGWSVSSAGDMNGDGYCDVIIGAPGASPNGIARSGESYLIFGAVDFGVGGVGAGGSFDPSSLNGSNGFVLNGVDGDECSGYSVSSAGDVNGDGIDDLVIGVWWDSNPIGNDRAGKCYVVYGASNLGDGGVGSGGSFDLSKLNGTNGFVLHGIDGYDLSARSVSSAGDVNGDGIDDLLIGARAADPDGRDLAGESYLVFGRDLGPCPPDTNGDGILDNGDIGVFVFLFQAGDLAADFNSDGILDKGDIDSFITSFLAGC